MSKDIQQIQQIQEAINQGDIPADRHLREALEESILKKSECHMELLATAAIALVAFSQAGVIAAAGVALIGLGVVQSKLKKSGEQARYYDCGDYARCVDKQLLEDLTYRYGPEILQAIPPPKPRPVVNWQHPDQLPKSVKETPQPVPPPDLPAKKEAIAAMPSRIAAQLQVSSVDTCPEPFDSIPDEIFEVPTPSIVEFMASRLKPTIITAKPRTGKGVIVSNAWKKAKELNPDLTVWVIQPKPHPTEMGYWQGCDRLWAKMIENYGIDDDRIAEELEEFILQWRQQQNRPTLLIIDELVKLEAVLPKWYRRIIPSLMKVESSSGETDQRYLWAITQSPLVSDLGLSGGNRSAFDLLALTSPETQDHLSSLQRSYPNIPNIIQARLKSYPRQSAYYHSAIGEWLEVPIYPVPSPVQDAPPLASSDVDAIAAKLQNWLEGTGQKYQKNGTIPAIDILKHWRYWHNGKSNSASKEEIFALLVALEKQGAIAIDKASKGIQLKASAVDQLFC